LFLLLLGTPAFANEPIFQAILGSSPPLVIGAFSKGIAFVGVILIEAFVFWKYFGLTLKKSFWASFILNVFSSGIGIFIGGAGFSSSLGFPIAIISVIVACVNVAFFRAPAWYKSAAIVAIIGGIFAVVAVVQAVPPHPPIVVFLMIISPLAFGFGLTLWLEGLASGRYLDPKIRWRALMTANLASYHFLIFMLVIFAPNPYMYNSFNFSSSINDRIDKGADPSLIVSMLHDKRASTSQLLGLSRTDSPGPDYAADLELYALDIIISRAGGISTTWVSGHQPVTVYPHIETISHRIEVAVAIIDDTLQIPTLAEAVANDLKLNREYLVLCGRVLEAIRNSDQEGFDAAYRDWTAWWENNPHAGDFRLHDPANWISQLKDNPEIKFTFPSEPAINPDDLSDQSTAQ
jgi:hypothetical protein